MVQIIVSMSLRVGGAIAWGECSRVGSSRYHGTGTGTWFNIGPHGAFVARASLVPGRLLRWAQRRAKSNSRLTAACDSFAEVHGP